MKIHRVSVYYFGPEKDLADVAKTSPREDFFNTIGLSLYLLDYKNANSKVGFRIYRVCDLKNLQKFDYLHNYVNSEVIILNLKNNKDCDMGYLEEIVRRSKGVKIVINESVTKNDSVFNVNPNLKSVFEQLNNELEDGTFSADN